MKITDVYDIEVLQKIQDAFSDATGFAAVTVDEKGKPVTETSNFTPYCNAIRSDEKRRARCLYSDTVGSQQAIDTNAPMIYKCHAGLVDMGVPIVVNGEYVGGILAGQIRTEDPEEMDTLPSVTGKGHPGYGDPELEKLYTQTEKTDLEKVKAGAELLYTISNYLAERTMVEKMQEQLHKKNLQLMEEVKLRNEVEATLMEAELKALQAQINPHFLFNVLNTIGRLALLENAERTQEMIYSFADMLRYTLKKEDNHIVTILEEMDHAKNYLTIQKTRLGDRLEYELDIDPRTEGILCPFMIIQPFVENALNHAIEPSSQLGKIAIRSRYENGNALITIEDNGVGMTQELIEKVLSGEYRSKGFKNTGIGINNADQRLQYCYGSEYRLKIESELTKGTKIIIRIPEDSSIGRK